MNPRSNILMGIAAALTVLVILRYTVWSEGGNSVVIQPAPPPITNIAIREESGDFLPPFSAFSAIQDRPLFRPDRRPEPVMVIETPGQTTGQETQSEPEFVVIGTVTGPDGGVATLRSQNETRRAYVGDTVEGWRVDAITGSGIEVSRNGDRFAMSIGGPE
ncbi:MAG: hypothetical protein COW29_05210 [Rhodobacterales bacterium CG15_BIG_FIL_POST_REV_8_21_14_020_59_13]|nr:MAG: hypothetical protein COW29_05210 [Rhodobacterales bacterium CG15_BIG_FIL_POST_REV_8_21_14_020_59_13]